MRDNGKMGAMRDGAMGGAGSRDGGLNENLGLAKMVEVEGRNPLCFYRDIVALRAVP